MKTYIKTKEMHWLRYPYDVPTQQAILKRFEPDDSFWRFFSDSQLDLFGTIVCEFPIIFSFLDPEKLYGLDFLLNNLPVGQGIDCFFKSAKDSQNWVYNPIYFFSTAKFIKKIDISLMLFLIRNKFILKTNMWLKDPSNSEIIPLNHYDLLAHTTLIDIAKEYSKQINVVENEANPSHYQGGGWLSLAQAHFEAGKIWLEESLYQKLSLPEGQYKRDSLCHGFEEYRVAHAHKHLVHAVALYERYFGNVEPEMCQKLSDMSKIELIKQAFSVMQITERCRLKLAYYNEETKIDRSYGYLGETFYCYLKKGEDEPFECKSDSPFQRFLSEAYDAKRLVHQANSPSNQKSRRPTIDSPKISSELTPEVDVIDVNLNLLSDKVEQSSVLKGGFFPDTLADRSQLVNVLKHRK